MARSHNGAAKWTAIVISGVLLVGGATAAHTRALARITTNTQNIEKLSEMAESIRRIELAIVTIATHGGIEVDLKKGN